MSEKVFTERQIKEILVKAMYAKDDNSYYDCDDCFQPDDEYYGWNEAVDFIQEQFGIKFEGDEIDDILMHLDL